MIHDLRLHGEIGPVGFFALVGGANSHNPYFYEEEQSRIRFFSKGNEIIINGDGIHYKGTGGSFCEYMFGVEKPLKDVEKKEIANRLIMFGAFLDEHEAVIFTNETEGRDSFSRLFLQGHAVTNYYFFVSSIYTGDDKKRQKQILKSVGKFLKRTHLIAEDRDTDLLDGFVSRLHEKKSTIFIFKLVHNGNQAFYKAFSDLYAPKRSLTFDEEKHLDNIVTMHAIDRYQQERMKIDIMYKHPDNKLVVDEYRDILLGGISKDALPYSEYAKLRRLRTLGIRNDIPIVLFETLDELLLKEHKVREIDEPEYLKETRSILQSLFFKDPSLRRDLIEEDIIRLLKAKQLAYTKGDKAFEQILLETVRACDEISQDNDDFSLFEDFTAIVTYFDRYDNIYTLLCQLAFMENVLFTEDSLRSLLGNKKEFDAIDKTLFNTLFINDLLNKQYVTAYGKRKISTIAKGLKKIAAGDASLKDIIKDLKHITEEEKLYRHIHSMLKGKMRDLYAALDTKKGRDNVREEISRELIKKSIASELPKRLFDKVLLDIKKETFYLNHLLPLILAHKDIALREDFLDNSGLDRFYIETLEKEYFENREIDRSLLDFLREGSELTPVGGGERI